MARVINFAKGVRAEVDNAIDYYESARDGLGMAFLEEVERAVEKVSHRPLSFPYIQNACRRCLIKKFPYAMIFYFDPSIDHIYIVAVMHTSRKPDFWLPRINNLE